MIAKGCAMRRSIFTVLSSLTLAACATAPATAPRAQAGRTATTSPQPLPVAAPAPLASDWNDWPYTPGEWAYRQDATGSQASFLGAVRLEEVILRCDRPKRVLHLNVRAALGTTIVRTTTATRSLGMSPTTGWEAPFTTIAIAATDPLLDAMAFSRGRFVIERPIAAPFVLPPHAEIGRVIEDCRG